MVILLVLFLSRNLLLSLYLNQKTGRFNKTFQADLVVREARITGLTSVAMTGISLRPAGGDTLLAIDSAKLSVNFWKLFTGSIVIREMDLKNVALTLTRKDSLTNYMFLLQSHGNKPDTARVAGKPDYAKATRRLSEIIFGRIPHMMHLSNMTVTANTNGHPVRLHTDSLFIDDHRFNTSILVSEDGTKGLWRVTGHLDNHNHLVEFLMWSGDSSKVSLPYLNYRWKAAARFDTIRFSLVERKSTDERTNLYGVAGVRGLDLDYEKIAANTVSFENLGIIYAVNVGSDYIELDSVSRVAINRLDFHPYIRYRPKPEKQITLRIDKSEFPAQDLFSSLPEGLFTNLEGFKVKGDLSWYLHFSVDLSLPDSLIFETELRRHGFGVISYGSSGLMKIDSSFLYTAYENGVPVRIFMVGPGNPNYRPISRISPYLQVSVLCSEDGGFYQHRGFLPEAFRESIITNIKERRFARGGSTITMQLVKNVFLNRNKTIARKLEEALLVWLIENQGLCTKERMLEVYLNIIEWGPGVYGANEAARFYFNKDASRLTLAESIFLASIIPRPKWFMYSFDNSGHLNESMKGFYRLLSEKMLAKGWITQKDFDNLIPDVELKGPAKMLLREPAPLPADSVPTE